MLDAGGKKPVAHKEKQSLSEEREMLTYSQCIMATQKGI